MAEKMVSQMAVNLVVLMADWLDGQTAELKAELRAVSLADLMVVQMVVKMVVH